MSRLARIGWTAGSVAVACLFLLAWQSVTDLGLIGRAFLPGPTEAFSILFDDLLRGDLWWPIAETVRRMLVGWLCACVLGVALGALIAASELARRLIEPTAEFLRPLPASAVIPAAILIFGLSDRMIVAVVVFGAIWPVLLGAVHGFRSVEPRLIEVARALQMGRIARMISINLPNAMPEIIAGARVSLAIALILAVVGEMLSSQPGIGHNVVIAARAYRSPEMYAGVIVLGALGFLTNLALERLEAYVLRWRPAVAGG